GATVEIRADRIGLARRRAAAAGGAFGARHPQRRLAVLVSHDRLDVVVSHRRSSGRARAETRTRRDQYTLTVRCASSSRAIPISWRRWPPTSSVIAFVRRPTSPWRCRPGGRRRACTGG